MDTNPNITSATPVVGTNPIVPPKKSNGQTIVIVLLVVLLLCCCCPVIASSIYSFTNPSFMEEFQKAYDEALVTPSTSPTPISTPPSDSDTTSTPSTSPVVDSNNSDLVFAYGNDMPPYSNTFANSIYLKKPLLSVSDGYFNMINGIGNPSYSYSMLYRSDWSTTDSAIKKIIMENESNSVSYGILLFDKNDQKFGYTCEQIVKDIFYNDDLTITKNSYATVNGESWNRIEYKVVNDKGVSETGIDQCLKKADGVIDHFIVATDADWNLNKISYTKLMDDIYVSKDSAAW